MAQRALPPLQSIRVTNHSMRITIFGATGLLGKPLLRTWTGDDVVGLGSKDADIREPSQVSAAVERTRPDWIVLAAAYTDVDGCETNPQLAFDVNCRGAENVARAAKQAGSRLLFVSTDYVFNGNKTTPYETDDPRDPVSVYGRSKAEGELAVLQVLPEACILRTAWLFGNDGPCFPETILKLAASRSELEVVNDQRGAPTYTLDLALTIQELCRKHAAGIVHAKNGGDCTRFDLACEIVARAGLPTIVHPVTSEKSPRPATRPKYSVLSPRSLKRYGLTMPTWQNALGRYLDERRAMQNAEIKG